MLAWVAEVAFAVQYCVAAEVVLATGSRLGAAEVVVRQDVAGLEERGLESELASAGKRWKLVPGRSIGKIHWLAVSQELRLQSAVLVAGPVVGVEELEPVVEA